MKLKMIALFYLKRNYWLNQECYPSDPNKKGVIEIFQIIFKNKLMKYYYLLHENGHFKP